MDFCCFCCWVQSVSLRLDIVRICQRFLLSWHVVLSLMFFVCMCENDFFSSHNFSFSNYIFSLNFCKCKITFFASIIPDWIVDCRFGVVFFSREFYASIYIQSIQYSLVVGFCFVSLSKLMTFSHCAAVWVVCGPRKFDTFHTHKKTNWFHFSEYIMFFLSLFSLLYGHF